MARTGKKAKKRERTGRLRLLALLLAVAIVCAVALVRYMETPRGKVFLLDLGFDGRYPQVRGELDAVIIEALAGAGVARKEIEAAREGGGRAPEGITVIRAVAPARVPLERINAEIDGAVTDIGAKVRSCREKRGGREIEMEIGTRRKITHRCYIITGRDDNKPAERRRDGPMIAIIVDDFGFFDNRLVREFLEIPVPVTVSVIPGLKHSRSICMKAREAGKEVICHLPMEPEKGAEDVGEIPLVRVTMSESEIEGIVEKALESTPGVTGMNNHMGSRATADRRVMDAVLKVCRKRKIFFVDSMTSSRSVVAEAAASAGVRSLGNDLFLDNRGEETRENMRKLISIAIRKGSVIGIMHARKKSLEDLRWLVDEARARGVEFVSISGMLEGKNLALNREGGLE